MPKVACPFLQPFSSHKGALWHAERASELLGSVDKKLEDTAYLEDDDAEEIADTGYLKLLHKATLVQIGKVCMSLGDYGKALECLDSCFATSSEGGAQGRKGSANGENSDSSTVGIVKGCEAFFYHLTHSILFIVFNNVHSFMHSIK